MSEETPKRKKPRGQSKGPRKPKPKRMQYLYGGKSISKTRKSSQEFKSVIGDFYIARMYQINVSLETKNIAYESGEEIIKAGALFICAIKQAAQKPFSRIIIRSKYLMRDDLKVMPRGVYKDKRTITKTELIDRICNEIGLLAKWSNIGGSRVLEVVPNPDRFPEMENVRQIIYKRMLQS
jgi:hypothetical protein